jgi:ParB-like chromosome segregation protein Spo0J
MAKKKAAAEPVVDPAATEPAIPASDKPLRLEWRPPAELTENHLNFRTHPDSQIAALTDVIGEVGWAGVCLLNEKTGRLLDGHARRKVAIAEGVAEVPVLIGSWSEEQERLILATFDTISAQATIDEAKLTELLKQVETDSKPLQDLLGKLAIDAGQTSGDAGGDASDDTIPDRWNILIECTSEGEQVRLLERLTHEGLNVRSLIT